MWILDRLAPGSPTHNTARAYRLRGPVDVAALGRALEAVVRRHATLRTVVVDERGVLSQLALEAFEMPLDVVNMVGAPEQAIAASLRERAREPFDLTRDLMIRATLIWVADDEHHLLLCLHHIAGDAHSDAILLGDLGRLYEAELTGASIQLPPQALQYADYAAWHRERLAGPLLAELIAYWTQALEGAPFTHRLPLDTPRPQVQRHVGARHDFTLPSDIAVAVSRVSQARGTTPFVVLFAVFATLVYRLGGGEDLVIGSPVAGRTHAGLEDIVGFFSNTVALRIGLSGATTFDDVVTRARETVLGAIAHQELPFEKVVSALRVPRTTASNPLFQLNFRARSSPPPRLELAGLTVEAEVVDIGFSRFDLSLELQLHGEQLSGYFEYDQDLFEPATIAFFVDALGSLLEQVVDDPNAEILALELPVRPRARGAPGSAMRARRRRPMTLDQEPADGPSGSGDQPESAT